MNDGDFDAKPMVLLIGQYSVGKTSFIRYLLGRDFPGQHIGPEPTTDRFIAVMHGQEDKTTPGNALAVSPNMPFRGLEMFGNGFLSKFQGAQLDVPLLNHVTLIDTPGILSGEKQRIGRTYEFTHVIEWFSARCDVILLLFDAHKLDISDEFKNAIECLKGQDDKIRVVLNKADQARTPHPPPPHPARARRPRRALRRFRRGGSRVWGWEVCGWEEREARRVPPLAEGAERGRLGGVAVAGGRAEADPHLRCADVVAR
jgi:hypothetical protein